MTDHQRELALTEARLLHAACLYVDAAEYGEDLGCRKSRWEEVRAARYAYLAALRALPADEELVERGMRVVRRLLEEGTTT